MPVDLEAKFSPNLLNSAIFLLSTAQSISTFAVNFQGRPFRENISENSALHYSLLGVAAVVASGSTNFVPEFSSWLQIVDMTVDFRTKLCICIVLDYGGAWLADIVLKHFFANNKPKPIITRGIERRDARRAAEREHKEKEQMAALEHAYAKKDL